MMINEGLVNKNVSVRRRVDVIRSEYIRCLFKYATKLETKFMRLANKYVACFIILIINDLIKKDICFFESVLYIQIICLSVFVK